MPTKRLPENPSLSHLKYQALDLQESHARGDASALQRLREFHPRMRALPDEEIAGSPLQLADFQLTIAREYGLATWARLKERVGGPEPVHLDAPLHHRIKDAEFRRAVDLMDAGDEGGLLRLLAEKPDLATRTVSFEEMNYFRNPSLLEFIAENPIRNNRLPSNAPHIAQILLDAGAARAKPRVTEALMLVATGCVAREWDFQDELIRVLVQGGGDPNASLHPALAHEEVGAARLLLELGARPTLQSASALGELERVKHLLGEADAVARHEALALAVIHRQAGSAGILLEAGEDPSRFNPVGLHSHSTPLHQAAWRGDLGMCRLLLAHGADPGIKDLMWQGDPAGWAEHGGRPEAAELIRNWPTSTQ